MIQAAFYFTSYNHVRAVLPVEHGGHLAGAQDRDGDAVGKEPDATHRHLPDPLEPPGELQVELGLLRRRAVADHVAVVVEDVVVVVVAAVVPVVEVGLRGRREVVVGLEIIHDGIVLYCRLKAPLDLSLSQEVSVSDLVTENT